MKITPKQYAHALLAATHGKERVDVDAIIGRFFSDLANRGLTRIVPAVIVEITRIDEELRGITRVHVTLPASDQQVIDELRSQFTAAYGISTQVETCVDAGIIDGFVLQIGDVRIDASMSRQLERLRAHLS